ncbi:MAG: radical SAM protein, partial [Spirochaetaceae bacterium]|nr:radical SAM protein [Spirochaetaceae bacterium]
MDYSNYYTSCTLCPHNCGVNRLSGRRGLCGETGKLRLAAAGIHFGEEPPLTRGGGSGTIFLSGCSMNCPFCQNYQISR